MAQRGDYPPIVSTNAVPDPEEVIAVQQGINRLKSEIAQAKSPRLQELEKDLRLHEAVFSPLRQIPVEVLGEIFTLALPDGVLQNRDRQHLVYLCLVCHTWRDAALSARWLWNRVGVKFDRTLSEKIVCWFNRSGNLPKSLAIDTEGQCMGGMDCADLGSDCRSRNANLAKFMTDGPTLDHLELNYPGSRCFRNFVEALHVLDAISNPKVRPWDCLRSLTLNFLSEWDEPDDNYLSTFLHIPSSITSLSVTLPVGLELDEDTSYLTLDIPPEVLQRLTSLAFTSDWEGDQALPLLRHCQNVETLTLNILSTSPFGNLTQSQLSGSTVYLPKLRTLRLQRLIPVAVSIFSSLRTPNLVVLDIQLENCGPRLSPKSVSFSQNVLSFVNQSKCENTLLQLCIRGWSFTDSDEDLAALLRGLPSVTHLTLHDIQNVTFFQKVRSPVISLPRLEVLELLELDPEIPFDDILVFLQSRRSVTWRDGSPIFHRQDTLKKVIVTYDKAFRGWRSYDDRQKDDHNSYLNALRRWCGVVVSVGPKEYL
jgi:hypothetical protein